jgi:hypothetical protein
MKRKIVVTELVFYNTFGMTLLEYTSLPRKKKKKKKRKLEQNLNNKFKLWLQEYERRTEHR